MEVIIKSIYKYMSVDRSRPRLTLEFTSSFSMESNLVTVLDGCPQRSNSGVNLHHLCLVGADRKLNFVANLIVQNAKRVCLWSASRFARFGCHHLGEDC